MVYMAAQTHPVERKVALKLIKPGLDTRQVVSRFDAERHALALMDHPNIAKVFDAGSIESGQPYFVMELVHGVPITEYCDSHRLTPRERLELFIPVCRAVQHAHQKGVIHRDLKPSNVMVAQYDAKPVPKVIDFGVAKATGPRLTEETLYTGFGTVVGTLEYMSPEQAAQISWMSTRAATSTAWGCCCTSCLPGRLRWTTSGRRRPRFWNCCGSSRRRSLPSRAAAVHHRRIAQHCCQPGSRSEEIKRPGKGRPRLDRDEGARQGPHAALRDGQRPGSRSRSVSA